MVLPPILPNDISLSHVISWVQSLTSKWIDLFMLQIFTRICHAIWLIISHVMPSCRGVGRTFYATLVLYLLETSHQESCLSYLVLKLSCMYNLCWCHVMEWNSLPSTVLWYQNFSYACRQAMYRCIYMYKLVFVYVVVSVAGICMYLCMYICRYVLCTV